MLETITIAVIQAILVSGIIGFFLFKQQETTKGEIAAEFRKRDKFFDLDIEYKKRSLEELLGPLLMQLTRSGGVLNKYKGDDLYSEAIFKQINETTRELLLNKSYLIPPDLLDDAADLLYHYDSWLQLYHQKRVVEKDTSTRYLFTYNFPPKAQENFKSKYDEYREYLKGDLDSELEIEGALN